MMNSLVVLRAGNVYFVVSPLLAASDKYDECELVAQWEAVGNGGYRWYTEQGEEVLSVEHMLLGATLRHMGIPVGNSMGYRFDVRDFVLTEWGMDI